MADRQFQEVHVMSPRPPPEQRSRYGKYQSVSSMSGINLDDREEFHSDTVPFASCTDLASILARLRSHLSLFPFFTTNQPLQSAYEERRRRTNSRMWKWARIGLSTIVMLWIGYCTARYLIAFRIYGGDPVRSQFALGMAIASLFTLVFFASEAALLLPFFRYHRYNEIIDLSIHSLTYISSAMIIGLSILNLILLHLWRAADQKSHSIDGRCNWDVDVVWSGTGLSCSGENTASFGDWLGAAISRLVISLIILVAYHLAVHRHLSAHGKRTPSRPDMEQVTHHRPSRRSGNTPLMYSQSPRSSGQSRPDPFVDAIVFSEVDYQRRSFSFTAAGQVLSRVEVDENYSEGNSDSSSESDSVRVVEDMDNQMTPDPVQGLTTYDMQHETYVQGSSSSAYDGITLPSNDIQDMASTFQSLVSAVMQQANESMLDHNPLHPPSTVRILGSTISRMSTISSMGSREAGSAVSTREESPMTRRNSNKNSSQRQDSSSDMLQSPSRQQTRSPTPPLAGPSRHGTNSSTLPSRRQTGSSLPSRRDTESPPVLSDMGPFTPSQYDTGTLPPLPENTGSSSFTHHDPAFRPPSRLCTASPLSFHHDIAELEGS